MKGRERETDGREGSPLLVHLPNAHDNQEWAGQSWELNIGLPPGWQTAKHLLPPRVCVGGKLEAGAEAEPLWCGDWAS